MPVTYQIDGVNRIIHTTCSGPITVHDVIDHFRALEQDPSVPDRVDVLLEVRKGTSVPQSDDLRRTISAFGAHVLEMTPAEHDHTLAFTSHLPQLLSTALAAALAQERDNRLSQVFGTGLLDMTRLALSSPELWRSILLTNKNEVELAIDSLVKVLLGLRADLGEREMANTFELATKFALSLRQPAPDRNT